MKRYYSYLFLAAFCTLLLCACAKADTNMDSGEDSNTQQTEESGVTVTATMPEEATPVPTEPVEQEEETTENTVPYTLSLEAAIPVYEGPSYDYNYLQVVGQDSIYTIVEEAWDEEGNLWGKLKSGTGWVDLTYVNSEEAHETPIMASFADAALLNSGNYHEHIVDDSEYMVKIAFWAREPLHNVELTSLQFTDTSYEATETLYTLDTLSADKPFVAGVVFYGDFTTYGISFTDSTNTVRYYAVCISGRNGALIINEYKP